MKQLHISIVLVLILAASGVSFFGGMQYQKSKTINRIGDFTNGKMNGVPGRNGAGFGGGALMGSGSNSGRNAMNFITGEVVQADEKGITVSMKDGGSKVILLSNSTEINKMAEGTLADLGNGTAVVVNGTSNADGSVTATMIQIRPEDGGMFGAPNMMRPPIENDDGTSTTSTQE